MRVALFSILITVPLFCHAMSDRIVQDVHNHIWFGEREIAIIVPTYNNALRDTCLRNLNSLLAQDYENFHIYLIDDCSTDQTIAKIKVCLKNHPRSSKVNLIENDNRVGALANYYHAIHNLEDHVIVINVDGDDWLPHSGVLSYINNVYADMRVWLTYGQYVEHPGGKRGFCAGYPKQAILNNSFRKHGLPISHLRTYYAWLFKLVKKEDLMVRREFMQATWDKAFMVPMIEMAAGHFLYLDEILYVYNAQNPLSDMRKVPKLQAKIRDRIFSMRPYEPLCDPITDFAVDAANV